MLTQEQRDALIAKEANLLSEIDFKYLRLNPTVITPFQSAQLSWKAQVPTGLHLLLNGERVAGTGSLNVAPNKDTNYSLVAKGVILQKTLATVRLDLNDAGCRTIEIAESLIAISVRNMLEAFVSNNSSLKVRNYDNILQIEPGKISLLLPLTIVIDNWFNADADIKATYSLGIARTEPRYTLTARLLSSSIDVSFSWWEHVLTLGLNAAAQSMAEAILDGFLHGFFGTQIKMDMEEQMNDTVRSLLNANERLFDVALVDNAVQLKVCPV